MADIRFEAVQRAFVQGGKEFLAVGGIDLVVANQEFVAIVGPSGCGKTTCMRMVAGLDQPSSGRVLVNGEEVTGPGPERAVVFQQFALFPWKTVFENIAFGLRAMGLGQAEIDDRVNRFIAMMGLSGYEQAYPHQLSGGMQQRVAIARAYVLDPGVLLMDEPSGRSMHRPAWSCKRSLYGSPEKTQKRYCSLPMRWRRRSISPIAWW